MNDCHALIDGIKLRKAVYLDTFRKESQSRLTGPMASCAPLFEKFRAVAAAVHDWEFKESCRQDMEIFVFNQDTLVVDISYLCDPFRDLADLGLRVLCK